RSRSPLRGGSQPIAAGFTNDMGIRYVTRVVSSKALIRPRGGAAESMQTVRVIGVLAVTAFVLIARTPLSQAQSDTRQRQAAAEAYDQGTAAYLSGDYEKAAEWFETANRMSPAAPALIQAARAHQQAGHLVRAATLALRLTLEHSDDATAMQFGQGLLERLA